jgi:hypothetical protein
MDENFKIIVLPSNLNPGAPTGENLVLVFTIREMERARRRGEAMLHNRMRKGISRDAAIRECLNAC